MKFPFGSRIISNTDCGCEDISPPIRHTNVEIVLCRKCGEKQISVINNIKINLGGRK